MRHRVAGKHLGRTSAHRLAMRRNIVCSLFEHETISTTKTKAREVRKFAERLITLAKKGTLAARRRAISLLGGDRRIIEEKDGIQTEKGTVVGKLFSELGPRYLNRQGGYTRIIRLALRRLGDNGELVLLQLVNEDESAKSKKKAKRNKAAKAKKAKAEVVEKKIEEVEVGEQGREEAEEEKAGEESKSGQAEESKDKEEEKIGTEKPEEK